MIIFISGSVNAGKSTTSKLVANRLGAEWVDVDEIAHAIPDFSLATDIPQAIDHAIKYMNDLTRQGKDIVANYVLRQKDYEQLIAGLNDPDQHYFTLAPRIDVARSDRGRGMSEWEYSRIQHHYDTGIANPTFGKIIDSSDMTLEQVANEIIGRVKN